MRKIFVEKCLYRYIEQKLSEGIIIRNSEWGYQNNLVILLLLCYLC